jgi:thymidylate synthase (FAD)|tara:strand:- start:5855 stop:6553 length:699 start_codon:yes stop_codon:yes gene_type:complete
MNKNKIHLYDDNIGCVEYIQHMGTDLTIVNSARVSFGKQKDSLDKKDKRLIKYLVNHKHTSTFEHNVITFRFVVPLFIRSQHHRHRTWSYNEISRRYTDIDLRFYEPKMFRTQHESNRQSSNIDELIDPKFAWDGETFSEALSAYHRRCLGFYNNMIDNGICREQARGVLPQNLYTEYYGTVNLNNLLKFVNLRTHSGAQWEIQVVAKACLDIASSRWPVAVKSFMDSSKDN